MTATGIIFSNVHDDNIPELTRGRTIASVPFGCRYRFIDFTLSNMVNSDIFNICVITSNNYLSLMDHIGSGKDWDLARRSGGIKMLPPNVGSGERAVSNGPLTRLSSLKSVNYALERITDEYVVLADCDVICNLDFRDMIAYHRRENADITFAVKTMTLTPQTCTRSVLFGADEDGRIRDVMMYPNHFEGEAEVSLNLAVMRTDYLKKMVMDSLARDYTSMTHDVVMRNLGTSNFRVYRYDGYFATVSSLADYFRYSMDLLSDSEARRSLFETPNRPIYTKVRNSEPTYYSTESRVSNSLLADGCHIEGTVEHSILFRGVRVGKGSVVRNCILMQDTVVGENASLNCVITDKNVRLSDAVSLSAVAAQPYYIPKNRVL